MTNIIVFIYDLVRKRHSYAVLYHPFMIDEMFIILVRNSSRIVYSLIIPIIYTILPILSAK